MLVSTEGNEGNKGSLEIVRALCILCCLLFGISVTTVSAQDVTVNGQSHGNGHGWGKGGKPKPTPTPAPGDPNYTRATSNAAATADQWSAGTNWDGIPTSGTTTQLVFGGSVPASLAAGATIFTNNDNAGDFQLNVLDFTYAGPASGTQPTVTISGGRLEFISNGATTPTLNLNASGTVTPLLTISNNILLTNNLSITGSSDAVLSGVIGGSATLTMNGTGIVTFSGSSANTYTGTTTVNAGGLDLNKTGVNAIAGDITIGGAGTLTLSASNQIADTSDVTLSATGLPKFNLLHNSETIDGLNSTNASAAVTILSGGTLTVGANNEAVANFAGQIVDKGGLTKVGTGTQILSGSAIYLGDTQILAGELRFDFGGITFNSTIRLGDTGGSNSATLSLGTGSGIDIYTDLFVNSGSSGTKTLRSLNTSGTNYYSGRILLSDALTLDSTGGGALVIDGVISGTNQGLTKTGTGRVELDGANTYTGATTIFSGRLSVSDLENGGTDSNIGKSTNAASNLVLGGGGSSSSATLLYTGSGSSTDRLFTLDSGTNIIDSSGTGPLNFTNTGSIAMVAGGSRSLTLTGASTSGTNTIAAVLSDPTGGVFSLLAGGGGSTWILTGTNTYTGTTFLGGGGTLGFNDGSLGTGTIQWDGPATLKWNGTNTQDVSSRIKILDGNTATFDTNSNNVTFASAFQLQTSNTAAIVKTGAGTLTLTAANNYVSGTTVNGGTLLVNNSSGSGTGSGAITVNSGGTLGGSGFINAGSNNVTINSGGTLMGGTGAAASGALTVTGSVSLQSNSVIQLALGGSGAHSTLAIATGGSISFQSSQKFSFLDFGAQTTPTIYTGIITGVGLVAPVTTGWTITNSGWSGTFAYDALNGGEIDLTLVAVPEPGTYAAAALAFAALMFAQRKRIVRKFARA
jgi:fibronectin-binding autotransporter adhesin